ncbi:MFS general substrate transporter [Rhizodiscina lignyota]|uniref:MFS general substrate transporter n=1 Tax=Rhizodiscina lignyota TaxID=1504668 RepID=A0A9P4IAM7_9PEZI|nr:MFS general substrate transporter [Rhizodiscina lignyota]
MEKDGIVHVDDKALVREVPLDPVAEKKLVRKCDLRVVPILFLLFLAAFLDRVNIGNAKIQGMIEDLHMAGPSDYNIALFIFFIPYILFEVPSNIIIKRVAPSTWLSAIMVLWGIATIGQGLVTTFGGLVACRFLVGLFEAGFFPGCVYLISMYYKRYELQWRLSLFFSASILAGAFGGLLAYAIAHMSGVANYGGWRWIFIIEGLATVVIAVAAKFVIVDWPETAKFLTEDERELLLARLAADQGEAKMNRLDKMAAKRAFKDWKIYCAVFMYMGVVTTGYATSFFIPTIITELGYKAEAAQVRSIPIFVVATVCSLCAAIATDKLRHRYAFTIGGVCLASIGYIMLLAQNGLSAGVKYFALFLIVAGGYICQPVCLVWISNNMGGHYKRSISSAMQVGFGNIGGIVASNVYLAREAPKYPTGYGVSLGFLWMCAICCTILFFGLKWENKKRDRGERDHRLQEPDADNLGDDHPHFRFTS